MRSRKLTSNLSLLYEAPLDDTLDESQGEYRSTFSQIKYYVINKYCILSTLFVCVFGFWVYMEFDKEMALLKAQGRNDLIFQRMKFDTFSLYFSCRSNHINLTRRNKQYLYNNIKNKNRNNDNLNCTTKNIPNNIFQTWKTQSFSDCRPIKVLEMNPNYNYWLFDDKEMDYFMNEIMIYEFDGNITKAYNMIDDINGAAKADLWRYSVLWKYGGVYLDFDATCFVSFDDIIHSDPNQNDVELIISSAWPFEFENLEQYLKVNGNTNDNVIKWLMSSEDNVIRPIQWQFISMPKSKILTRVIEMVINNILNKQRQNELHLNYIGVDMTHLTRDVTGPEVFLQAMNNAIIKDRLIKDVDYKIYGYHWKGQCKHYHWVKGFYRYCNAKRYNDIKNRPFLKQDGSN